MKMFFKLTVNNEEYDVIEIYTKQTLYSYLYDKKIKGLSYYEDGDFYINGLKSITVNGICLKLFELCFDSFNYVFAGFDKDGIMFSIYEEQLSNIHSLEIEL